ncbi:MAG: hypothetical protein ACERKX_14990, partial [Anaerolineales bacterium]
AWMARLRRRRTSVSMECADRRIVSPQIKESRAMETEEIKTIDDATRKREGDALSGGIFLISLGVLIFTGWWWPGIMVALGLSGGAGLIFRGRTREGISTLVFSSASPLPWNSSGAPISRAWSSARSS